MQHGQCFWHSSTVKLYVTSLYCIVIICFLCSNKLTVYNKQQEQAIIVVYGPNHLESVLFALTWLDICENNRKTYDRKSDLCNKIVFLVSRKLIALQFMGDLYKVVFYFIVTWYLTKRIETLRKSSSEFDLNPSCKQ